MLQLTSSFAGFLVATSKVTYVIRPEKDVVENWHSRLYRKLPCSHNFIEVKEKKRMSWNMTYHHVGYSWPTKRFSPWKLICLSSCWDLRRPEYERSSLFYVLSPYTSLSTYMNDRSLRRQGAFLCAALERLTKASAGGLTHALGGSRKREGRRRGYVVDAIHTDVGGWKESPLGRWTLAPLEGIPHFMYTCLYESVVLEWMYGEGWAGFWNVKIELNFLIQMMWCELFWCVFRTSKSTSIF